jgi:hypothetical protein
MGSGSLPLILIVKLVVPGRDIWRGGLCASPIAAAREGGKQARNENSAQIARKIRKIRGVFNFMMSPRMRYSRQMPRVFGDQHIGHRFGQAGRP